MTLKHRSLTIPSGVHSKDQKKDYLKLFSVIISVLLIWNYYRYVVSVIILVSLWNKLFKTKDSKNKSIPKFEIELNINSRFLFKRKYVFRSSIHWKDQETMINPGIISSFQRLDFGPWIPLPTKRNMRSLENWLTLEWGRKCMRMEHLLS